MCCRKTVGLGVEPCRKAFLNEHSSKFFICRNRRTNLLLNKKEKTLETWPEISWNLRF